MLLTIKVMKESDGWSARPATPICAQKSSCGPQPHQLRRHDILCGPFHFIVHWILAAHPFEMIAMI